LTSSSNKGEKSVEGEEAKKPSRLPPLLEALRPKQWTKNVLLFAGFLFTLHQPRNHVHATLQALAAFALFCLLSGCTYLVNDLLDVEADRLHPKKKERPLASGRLSVGVATAAAALGIPLALGGSFLLGVKFAVAASSYALLTLAYSLFLKRLVLVDVLTLAILFVIRAAAGALAIGVRVSEWLLMCTLLLALFLGLAKRRGELAALGDAPPTRAILAEYSLPMLDQLTTIIAACTVISYTQYAFFSTGDSGTGRRPYLMATIPFVLYGIFRYLYLIHKKGGGETPEATLLEDRPMLVNILLFILVAAAAMTLSR
jgi:4-hydroxybenzoate polyprenyltransferase